MTYTIILPLNKNNVLVSVLSLIRKNVLWIKYLMR
jgi:hypothetical protein